MIRRAGRQRRSRLFSRRNHSGELAATLSRGPDATRTARRMRNEPRRAAGHASEPGATGRRPAAFGGARRTEGSRGQSGRGRRSSSGMRACLFASTRECWLHASPRCEPSPHAMATVICRSLAYFVCFVCQCAAIKRHYLKFQMFCAELNEEVVELAQKRMSPCIASGQPSFP